MAKSPGVATIFSILFILKLCDYALSIKRQNVLLILVDDGGFEIGAYGNRICQTPNIDALARNSFIFNNAFTSVSSCSPSRAALLTGEPAHSSGMYGLHHGVHHFSSFAHVHSLPAQLRDHGVYTGLIGKKHVGPASVFAFDYERTEMNNSINQVGRNITHIKLLVRDFLEQAAQQDKPFFLMVSFHDPHRCGHTQPQYGAFCERFGSGEPGMGRIPDWQPWYYQWDEIDLPYYVQDTEAARRDLAAQYTTISRLDQGVGLTLGELARAGRAGDTLVLYTSDNGPPFPGARTNLRDAGARVPLLARLPAAKGAAVRAQLVSLLDVAPTLRDWFGVPEAFDNEVEPPQRYSWSLLPLLRAEPAAWPRDALFMSHTHHEVTMYYPMRAVRTRDYKLIHNINFGMPFPIDQDLYVSPTFQDILNRTSSGAPLPWYTSLERYYRRPQWELYHLRDDPTEMRNLHGSKEHAAAEEALAAALRRWQAASADPWRCAPHAVLEAGRCLPLHNGLHHP